MKKLSVLLAVHAILISSIFTNCSKGKTTIPPADTSLEITIRDYSTSTTQSGVTVKLFTNANDLVNQTNLVATKTTDISGKVKFTGLSAIRYYWSAQSGCKNNAFLPNSTASSIISHTNNTINAQVQGVGTLAFNNTSSNPYRVYVNGIIVINSMNGGTNQSIPFPADAYTIRVLQLSGYVITPTDKNYTGALVCGGTLVTTFP